MTAILIGAAGIALGTWLGAPTLAPVVAGAALGLLWPRRAARHAALAAALAWGASLLVAAFRGDALERLSSTLGGAMGLPAWVLFAATLLYPATLASAAAWLAHLVSPRRTDSIDRGATMARHQSPT